MARRSLLGFSLAGIYVLLCVFFIATQGLFGESFIALLLGLPWSMILASIEFGGVEGALLYALVLGPLALNAVILYALGALVGRWLRTV